jgi:transcription elongation factor Elf1
MMIPINFAVCRTDTCLQREPLATRFKCVFCSNETSVGVQIDRKNSIGSLSCNTCGQSFQSKSSMGKRESRDLYPAGTHLLTTTQ